MGRRCGSGRVLCTKGNGIANSLLKISDWGMVPIGHQDPARAHGTPPRLPAFGVEKNSGAKIPERLARSGLEFGAVRYFFIADPCAFNRHQRCASFWLLCFFLAKSENDGSKQVKIAFGGLNPAMHFSLFVWGLTGAQSDASGQ